MPAERTLPIAAGHREFTVKVDGQAVGRERHLLGASLRAQAGRIAGARLTYADGDAAAGDFALSSSDLFVPGRRVEVLAEGGAAAELLFTGVVVAQSLKLRPSGAPQLVVECRHAAFKLAAVPRSANHLDTTDAELIAALLDGAGIDADVAPTRARHVQLVQPRCSDWDWLLARARANGLRVFTRAAQVVVRAPKLDAEPVATLRFGATLIDFDATIDARRQFTSTEVRAWSPAEQAVAAAEGQPPSFRAPGNLKPDVLGAVAGAARAIDRAALGAEEAQALADAARVDAALAQLRARVACVGIGQVMPGDVVELAGLGARFSGRALVTGVRHEFDAVQGWRTHLQVGDDERAAAASARETDTAPAARLDGLQIGVVTSIEDPAGEQRVRLQLSLVGARDDGVWARLAAVDAGKGRGFVFRPEPGDEVVVGFLDADPHHPVVLGMLHSSAHPAPIAAAADNPEKGYVSRAGLRLSFDDVKKSIALQTPAGQALHLGDDDQALVLADQHGNRITLGPDGIAIESANALVVKAGGDAQVEAGNALSLTASGRAELSSAGPARIAGSLVQIN